MAEKLKTYGEFWPYYLAEHSRPGTRALHYLGTGRLGRERARHGQNN